MRTNNFPCKHRIFFFSLVHHQAVHIQNGATSLTFMRTLFAGPRAYATMGHGSDRGTEHLSICQETCGGQCCAICRVRRQGCETHTHACIHPRKMHTCIHTYINTYIHTYMRHTCMCRCHGSMSTTHVCHLARPWSFGPFGPVNVCMLFMH
jgi:hypothetical protein